MKGDRFRKLDFTGSTEGFPISRRSFLKGMGGIAVFFAVGDLSVLEAQERRGRGFDYPTDFNAYLLVGEDGRVSCFTGKVELGQGVVTSLAQMLADELDVPLDSVDMVMGDTDRCPWDMGTFGSLTIRFFGPPLRAAGAEARAVLLELAAERLEVPVDRLDVEGGVVFDKTKTSNRVTYAELTKGKQIARHLDPKPPVKTPAQFKVIGKSILRRDSREKVTGQARYAGDVRLPGMLYAGVLRPPAHGATLKSVDFSAASAIEGVQTVRDGDLVAVLHASPDVARQALQSVKAQFDSPQATVDDVTIFDHLLKVAPKGEVVAQGGDLGVGLKQSALKFERKYLNSYVAHAPMEPHTAVAQIEGEKVTVWSSTQTPFPLRDGIANALEIPAAKVRVITPFVGGGFGGKSANLETVQAVRLARLTGKPVQVAWTRAEEFFYDTFRPAAVVTITSGVTGAGRISQWDYAVYFAGQRGAEQFYDIPHHRTTVHGAGWRGEPGAHPFDTGPWRAPGNNTNTFARESQIDIMAAEAGVDPIEFRLNNLTNERMKAVLNAAAEKFGWTRAKTKAPTGRGFGVACGIDSGTYVAHVAEVRVDKATGVVEVKRVACAQDMGLSVNPEGARLQMEGCITMGLGYALKEEIHFKGGEILDLNFGTYEIPRFSWTPQIDTVLVGGVDAPSEGGGEPAVICMGAVVANAVFDATGARLFQLPLTPERILAAMRLVR